MDPTHPHPRRRTSDFATQLQVVGARTLRSLQGFLALILSISIFGASLFGVLVSQLQPPGNGWSDSTVRTLMGVSWLLFVLALGVAAFSAVMIGPPFADDGVGPAALGGGGARGGGVRGGEEEEEEAAPRFDLVEPVMGAEHHHLHPHLRPDLHRRRPSSDEKPKRSSDPGDAATAAAGAQHPGVSSIVRRPLSRSSTARTSPACPRARPSSRYRGSTPSQPSSSTSRPRSSSSAPSCSCRSPSCRTRGPWDGAASGSRLRRAW